MMRTGGGRGEAEPHPAALYFQHRDGDIVTDSHLLTQFSAENQHGFCPSMRLDRSRTLLVLTSMIPGYPISYYIYLKDGGKFTATLGVGGFGDDAEQHAFKSLEDFKGKMVRVTGRVESSGNTFGMWVRDLANIEVVKE